MKRGLAAVLVALAPAVAAADPTDDLAEGALYGGVNVAAAFTLIGNGVSLAYDEPVGRGWRIGGAITGGAAIALGTGLLIERHGTPTSVAIGVIPITLGVASCLSAWLAKDEGSEEGTVVVPVVDSSGALSGAGVALRF